MSSLTYEEEIASARRGVDPAVVGEIWARQNQSDEHAAGRGHGPRDGGGAINTKTIADMVPTLGRLLKIGRKYWGLLGVAVALAIGGAILSVLSPGYLGKITDEISAGLRGSIDMVEVRNLTLTCAAILVGSFIFSYVQSWLMATITQRMAQILRHQADRKIDRMPLRYFDRTSQGDVLSRFTNDIDTLSQTLNSSVSSILSGVTLLLGSTIMMFTTEWRMALAGISASIVGFALTLLLMAVSQRHFDARQRRLGALNGHIEESFSGHAVVRAYNAEEIVKREFASRNAELYRSTWKADFLSGLMMPIMGFIGNLGYVVVCVVGAVLVMGGSIDIGVITAFMLYIRLFTQPLSNIAQAATQFQGAAAAGTRVFEFLDEEELSDEVNTVRFPGRARGQVVFDDVRFGYMPGQEIIHGFSATVEPGQKVAIVGPTGAGKTTLVNLLMRFYDIDSGRILLDGVPTSTMRREDVDAQFAMVLQDTWLFHGTLRENLVYRSEGITDADLDRVIDDIGLRDLINQLPHGYDTVIGEDTQLSAGQKQLVTIARAMIANNPLLILDEATSSIDTRTERLIQQAIDKVTAGRTSFVIAHRLSTIRDADIIFVMNHGDIVEAGSHDDLLKRGGFYAELYNSQFDTPIADGNRHQ